MKMHKLSAERPQVSSSSRVHEAFAAFEATPSQEAALQSIDTYLDLVGDERDEFAKHARRTEDLVQVFAGDYMPSKAIDAVLLHDIGDRATGGDARRIEAASAAFVEYLTSPEVGEKEGEYVVSLIKDMTTIEDTATQYREMGEPELHLREGDPNIWSKETPAIPLDDMFTLSKNVNIESVIIKSCEMLDNLHHPAKTDLAVMHDIFEAESFYAPVCEVLGYDGLAMELRSYAQQIRLVNQGHEDLVVNVKRFCHEMRRLGPESVLSKLAPVENFNVSRVVNQPRYIDEASDVPYESVDLGEFALDLDGRLLAGNWRIKSVGSLANKIISSDQKEMPMDVMGVTVISEDTDTVASDFSTVVRHTVESSSLTPKNAPSKEHPFIVQGDTEYINAVCARMSEELGEDFVNEHVQKINKENGYRVSKFTCLGDDSMPIEMQFVTKEDRKEGRVGEWAHIFHKQRANGIEYSDEELAIYASQLKQIHERKKHMKVGDESLMVNPRSLIQGRRTKDNLYARYDMV